MAITGHAKLISETIGSTDAARLALVEEIMRCAGPTLDALDRRQFRALARRSVAAATEMRARGELGGFCQTFGLAFPEQCDICHGWGPRVAALAGDPAIRVCASCHADPRLATRTELEQMGDQRVVHEIGHDEGRTVGDVQVSITELIWSDGGHSFDVYRSEVGALVTEEDSFGAMPADAQVQAALDWRYPPGLTVHERDEGQFWACCGHETQGPYASREGARQGHTFRGAAYVPANGA